MQYTGSTGESTDLQTASSFTCVNGQQLHFVTAGHGQPTVVFESGTGLDVRLWRQVLPEIAPHNRVLAYERAGVGRSEAPSSARVSLEALVHDLAALLTALELPGPFVLVGHSLGGCVVRLFAALHPDRVAGLVLVDPMHEGSDPLDLHWQKLCGWEGFASPWPEFTAPMRRFAADTSPYMRLPPVPAIVLSIDWEHEPPRDDGDWGIGFGRSHVDLAASMARGRYVLVPESSHFISRDQPGAVIEAIKTVVGMVRAET